MGPNGLNWDPILGYLAQNTPIWPLFGPFLAPFWTSWDTLFWGIESICMHTCISPLLPHQEGAPQLRPHEGVWGLIRAHIPLNRGKKGLI